MIMGDYGILYTNLLTTATKDEEKKEENEEEESTARPRLILIASIIIALGIVLTAINYLQPEQPTGGAVVIDLTNETTTAEVTTTTEAAEPETTIATTTEETTTILEEGLSVVLKKGTQSWDKYIKVEGKEIDLGIDLDKAIMVQAFPEPGVFFKEVPFSWSVVGVSGSESAFSEPTENSVSTVTMTWDHPDSPGVLNEVGKFLSYTNAKYNVNILVNGEEVESCTVGGTGGPWTDMCALDVPYDAEDVVKIVVSSDKIWLTNIDYGFVSSDTPGGKDPFFTMTYTKDLKTMLEYDASDNLYLFYK